MEKKEQKDNLAKLRENFPYHNSAVKDEIPLSEIDLIKHKEDCNNIDRDLATSQKIVLAELGAFILGATGTSFMYYAPLDIDDNLTGASALATATLLGINAVNTFFANRKVRLHMEAHEFHAKATKQQDNLINDLKKESLKESKIEEISSNKVTSETKEQNPKGNVLSKTEKTNTQNKLKNNNPIYGMSRR